MLLFACSYMYFLGTSYLCFIHLKAHATKAEALCSGDVRLFVCWFVVVSF